MDFLKYITFLIVLANIYSAYNDCVKTEITVTDNGFSYTQNTTFSASKGDDCKDRTINDDDKNKKYKTHCCYVTYDQHKYINRPINDQGKYVGIEGSCTTLTDVQYNHINDLIKHYENVEGFTNVQIDCKSYYLQLGIISILLLILF